MVCWTVNVTHTKFLTHKKKWYQYVTLAKIEIYKWSISINWRGDLCSNFSCRYDLTCEELVKYSSHMWSSGTKFFFWCEELVPILYTYKSLTHATVARPHCCTYCMCQRQLITFNLNHTCKKKKKNKNWWRVSPVSSEFVNDFLLHLAVDDARMFT